MTAPGGQPDCRGLTIPLEAQRIFLAQRNIIFDFAAMSAQLPLSHPVVLVRGREQLAAIVP
jgi:hypothetical protein